MGRPSTPTWARNASASEPSASINAASGATPPQSLQALDEAAVDRMRAPLSTRNRDRVAVSDNRWLRIVQDDPGHSAWHIERFRTMAAEGTDLDSEAHFVDAMAARAAWILDAGCGPGRVGGGLTDLGHHVVGVDIDPELIDEARRQHPDTSCLARELAMLDLPADGIAERFDVIVAGGSVMAFLDPATRVEVLRQMRGHLAPEGRVAVGLGAQRDYEFDGFSADASSADLREDLRLSTWDLRPFTPSSDFLLVVLSARSLRHWRAVSPGTAAAALLFQC
jgi:SAM-dependent methyltransferase